MTSLIFRPIDTPVGRLGIICSGKSIIRLLFDGHNPEKVLSREMQNSLQRQTHDGAAEEMARRCAGELAEYFMGRRHEFSVPVSLDGTPFEKAVWAGLLHIPYGQTVSYSQLGDTCGLRGARAIGTAVGRNPVPILVPCHRVIRKDGSMGGYAGGTDVKAYLLELERKSTTQSV